MRHSSTLQVPETLRDPTGAVWTYQFGQMYANGLGTLRHRDDILRER